MVLPAYIRNLARDAILNVAISSKLFPRGLRWRAMRLVGLDVSKSTINAAGFFGGRNISIGEGSFLNYEVYIDNSSRVTIGSNCSLGPRVALLTGTHAIGTRDRRAGFDRALPIVIGDGSWLGGNVTVLPGVTIGAGSVIAAGAVVTSDCDANSLYAGVPARKIRELELA